jgi:hypothetical protein
MLLHHKVHQEHDREESDQASMPLYHEDKGLVRNEPPQISELSDTFHEDLKKDISENELLESYVFSYLFNFSCNDEDGSQRYENIEEKFQNCNHSRDK